MLLFLGPNPAAHCAVIEDPTPQVHSLREDRDRIPFRESKSATGLRAQSLVIRPGQLLQGRTYVVTVTARSKGESCEGPVLGSQAWAATAGQDLCCHRYCPVERWVSTYCKLSFIHERFIFAIFSRTILSQIHVSYMHFTHKNFPST